MKKARINRAHFLNLHKYLHFIEESIWKTHQEASSDKVSNEGYPQWRSIFPTPKLAIESRSNTEFYNRRRSKVRGNVLVC